MAPGVARAAQRDGRDTRGALDIASVSHSHRDTTVTHLLSTYRPFSGKLLKGGNAVAFGFDVTGDHRPDRLVLALWVEGRLRGAIVNARGQVVGLTRIGRPNQRSISFSLPEEFFGQTGRYEWFALTSYKSTKVCRKTCTDVAPNRGLMSHVLWQLETLSVVLNGNGRVRTVPKGIDCTTTCSARLRHGSILRFEATANEGWMFTGWGGACAGMDNCAVQLEGATSVTATFVPLQSLRLTVEGPAAVSVAQPGGECRGPSTCVYKYVNGTTVTLTAVPGLQYLFDGWSGDCAGSGLVCTLTMTSDRSVVAHTRYKPIAVTVGVENGPGAGGHVTSVPLGIDCPGDCAETWTSDLIPTLTATPDPGSVFVDWKPGVCHGIGPVCMLALWHDGTDSKHAVAMFAAAP